MKKRSNKIPWLNPNILGFSLGSFFGDISQEMTTVALPMLIASIAGPLGAPFYTGLITGVGDAGASISRLLFGYLSDRSTKRKPFIIIGYALSCVFISMIGAAYHIKSVLLYRLIAWMGKGVREPARDALISESVSQIYYGRAFGFHRAMDSLGSILGPVLALVLMPFISLRGVFFLSFVPSFLSVLAIKWLTKDIPGKIGITSFSLKNFVVLLPRAFWRFAFLSFLFSCANFSGTLLILRAQELMGLEDSLFKMSSLIIIFYTAHNIIRTISEYSIGWLSDIYDRKILLAAIGYCLFGFIAFLLSMEVSQFFLAIAFLAAGISAAAYTTLERSYAADLLPLEVRGTGYGMLHAVRGIGGFFSSFIVGWLWSSFSPAVGFGYAAIVSFIAGLLLLIL